MHMYHYKRIHPTEGITDRDEQQLQALDHSAVVSRLKHVEAKGRVGHRRQRCTASVDATPRLRALRVGRGVRVLSRGVYGLRGNRMHAGVLGCEGLDPYHDTSLSTIITTTVIAIITTITPHHHQHHFYHDQVFLDEKADYLHEQKSPGERSP